MTHEARVALGVSALVLVIIGFAIYIVMQVLAKKMRNKMLKKTQEEAMIQIQALRNDLGELPYELKDYLKSKANDIDIEGIINTIYRNEYKNVLVVNNQDLFPIVAIAQKIKGQTYVYSKEIQYDKLEDLRLKFPDHFPNEIKLYDDSEIDCLILMNAKGDINDIFDKLSKKLHKGMILVSFANPKSEMKRMISYLKMTDMPYEVSYISSKYLFIVKK
ncbi:BC85_0335 family putative methyltransferase [Mycoplasma sp. Sp48II]|uniref:BC85_0335 family putative methyltransferase n=1 Tax=unclassified Mycoplasma TaxID=2683645 RepID=UPI003A867868